MKLAKKYEKENKIHRLITVTWRKITLKIEDIFSVKGAHAKENKIQELYRKVVRHAKS